MPSTGDNAPPLPLYCQISNQYLLKLDCSILRPIGIRGLFWKVDLDLTTLPWLHCVMRARIYFRLGARSFSKESHMKKLWGKWWNMWGECEGKDGACEGWWWVSNDSLSRVRLGDTRRGEARWGDGFDYGSRSWLRRRRARGNVRCEAPGDGSQAFVIANVRLGLGGEHRVYSDPTLFMICWSWGIWGLMYWLLTTFQFWQFQPWCPS